MPLSDRVPYTAMPDRPRLSLPGGARLAVWLIVNVEDWRIDMAQPRALLPPPMGKPLVPDVPNWSWHEYGMRVGVWRFLEAIGSRELAATLMLNGRVCQSYPRVAKAALEAGWEFAGHGFVQGPMHALEDQAGSIREAIASIEDFTGNKVAGWESPGLTETDETLDLLAAAGIRYVADWVIDDLPQRIDTPHGPLVTLPYTVEVNDVVVHAVQQHPAEEFLRRGIDQFERLYAEAAHQARIMAISIHPYLTGVPHRIGYLERLLDHVRGREGVAFMTGEALADWYRAAAGID